MHPEVDIMRRSVLAAPAANAGIHAAQPLARSLLKEMFMRTTSKAMLCALLPACVSGGHHSYSWDGGGGDGAAACASTQTVTQDLTLSDNDVLDAPTGCWTLNGKLTIQGSSVTSLAKLGQLTGVLDLEIAGSGLTKIDTPRAVAVSRDISIHDNTVLADVSNLTAGSGVLGAVHVHANPALVDLGMLLSTVRAVSGEAMFMNDDKLAKLDLHTITRFDMGIEIGYDAQLAAVDLSGLQYTPLLWVHDDLVLTTLNSLGSMQLLGDLRITNCPVLTAIGFPAMSAISGSVEITGDAALTDLGQLSHVGQITGSVTISNDPALDYCAAHEVDCCVPTGTFTISGVKQDNNCHSYCFANNNCPF
jgi:hypothetical protein